MTKELKENVIEMAKHELTALKMWADMMETITGVKFSITITGSTGIEDMRNGIKMPGKIPGIATMVKPGETVTLEELIEKNKKENNPCPKQSR
ncbi:MAG: hypothetical protein ABFD75_07420 [Smithella sp.]